MSKAVISSHHDDAHGSVKSYTAGFVLSLVLTGGAYVIADKSLLEGWNIIYALMALAVVQLFVQLFFFLHLGRESKPRWNLAAFCFALMVVFIVVFGSLWIMKNLNYSHMHMGGESHTHSGMPANQPDETIIKDEGYQHPHY